MKNRGCVRMPQWDGERAPMDAHVMLGCFLGSDLGFRPCILSPSTMPTSLASPSITSVSFWALSDPAWSISYADSVFLIVSAMTDWGLDTINLSHITTWQRTVLFLGLIGSSIWVSIWTIVARKHSVKTRFPGILRADHRSIIKS